MPDYNRSRQPDADRTHSNGYDWDAMSDMDHVGLWWGPVEDVESVTILEDLAQAEKRKESDK